MMSHSSRCFLNFKTLFRVILVSEEEPRQGPKGELIAGSDDSQKLESSAWERRRPRYRRTDQLLRVLRPQTIERKKASFADKRDPLPRVEVLPNSRKKYKQTQQENTPVDPGSAGKLDRPRTLKCCETQLCWAGSSTTTASKCHVKTSFLT